MRVLSKAGLFRGLILYHRQERILAPYFTSERRDGVTTLISDAREVEASQYFPAENRFRANIVDIADVGKANR